VFDSRTLNNVATTTKTNCRSD